MANPTKNVGEALTSPLTELAIKASIEEAYDKATGGSSTAAITIAKTGRFHWQGLLLAAQKKKIIHTFPLKLLVVGGLTKTAAEAVAKQIYSQGGYTGSQVEQVSVYPETPETSSITPPTDQAGVSNQLERMPGNSKNIFREVTLKFANPYDMARGTNTVKIRNIMLRIPQVVPLIGVGIFAYHLNQVIGDGKKFVSLKSPKGVSYAIPKTLEHVKALVEELAKGDS